jgi:hypothetical protein
LEYATFKKTLDPIEHLKKYPDDSQQPQQAPATSSATTSGQTKEASSLSSSIVNQHLSLAPKYIGAVPSSSVVKSHEPTRLDPDVISIPKMFTLTSTKAYYKGSGHVRASAGDEDAVGTTYETGTASKICSFPCAILTSRYKDRDTSEWRALNASIYMYSSVCIKVRGHRKSEALHF